MKVPESSPQQNPLILWELFASRQKFAASPVEWGTLLSDPAVSLLDSGESNPFFCRSCKHLDWTDWTLISCFSNIANFLVGSIRIRIL